MWVGISGYCMERGAGHEVGTRNFRFKISYRKLTAGEGLFLCLRTVAQRQGLEKRQEAMGVDFSCAT